MALKARHAIIAVSLAVLFTGPAWAEKAKSAAHDDPVVARVNGTEIHRSDVLKFQQNLPERLQKLPIEKLYPKILDQMVNGELVTEAAKKLKLENTPEVKERLAQLRDQVIQDAYVDRILKKGVSDKKLHALYDKYVKDAPPREEVNARHILVPTEDEAKAIIAELKKGADFATLAKEKTTDPSGKTSGGSLGWFTREQMVPAFATAAFKLKKGEVSPAPVKTQFGWHVIKVEDRRTAKPPTFEQVKPQLQNKLAHDLVNERLKQLRSEAKIETFALDGSPQTGPGIVANRPMVEPTTSEVPKLSPATAPDKLQKK